MGEDEKSYLHFFEEPLIIKLVIFMPASKEVPLPLGRLREAPDTANEHLS
jgi:hypothetical protein